MEERAAAILVQQGLCASTDEAANVLSGMMMMMMMMPSSSSSSSSDASLLLQDRQAFVQAGLCCFDVPASQLEAIFDSIHNQDDQEQDDANNYPPADDDDEVDDDDNDYIGEGECELCERHVKLTRHHLIPRSTWPRLEARLLQAIMEGRAVDIGCAGLEHLWTTEEVSKNNINANAATWDRATQRQWVRDNLQRVCLICRQCHSAVHRTHDNMTLALSYNTVEKLLDDPAIYKFAKWASTQRPKGIR